jgi:hypothetical protein
MDAHKLHLREYHAKAQGRPTHPCHGGEKKEEYPSGLLNRVNDGPSRKLKQFGHGVRVSFFRFDKLVENRLGGDAD